MVHIIGLGSALGGIFLSSIVYWAAPDGLDICLSSANVVFSSQSCRKG